MRKTKPITIRLSQAAQLLGVSSGTVRRWVDKELLKGTRTLGGHRRVYYSEIRRILARVDEPVADPLAFLDDNHPVAELGDRIPDEPYTL